MFDLKDAKTVEYLRNVAKDVNEKFPDFFKFLEDYCGYNTAVLSPDPAQISYSAGKRDVILTLKTIMRDDILPEQIAEFYTKGNFNGR